MQLQTHMRVAATTPVVGTPALRPREEREPRPVEGSGGGAALRARTTSEQAAILHWGAAVEQARHEHEREHERLPGERSSAPGGGDELSRDEQQSVQELQRRDREVRAHEQTHRSLGGQHAGSVHLDYQVGPDGRRYAVSGSTPIDMAPVPGDPLATLRKMEIVQRAATAPASPSGADRQIAAQAAKQAQQARAEMAAERYEQARLLARGGAGGAEQGPAQAALPRPAAGSSKLATGSSLSLRG